MSTEIIIKVCLIIYAILSAGLVYLIWNNTSGESNFKNISTLLGAVALVIFAAAPYLKKDKKQEISSIILFRDGKTDKLISGDPLGPYQEEYSAIFGGIEGSGDYSQISYSIAEVDQIALIQKGVMQQLIRDLGNGDWDAEVNLLQGVYGSGNRSETKFATGTPGRTIDTNDLKTVFSFNKFVTMINGLNGQGISVPVDSQISGTLTQDSWTIIMENNDFKISIALTGYGGGNLRGGAWGVFHNDEEVMNRYLFSHYTIVTIGETKFGKRQVQLIDSYWKWYASVIASVKHFNWANIDQKLVDYHHRKTMWKSDSMIFRGQRFPL